MANMSWTKRPDIVVQEYNARNGPDSSSSLFIWATFTVNGLYYLGDVDAVWDRHPDLSASHQPDTVDMAHARWAVGSAITALDLCAAALGRLYCNWSGPNELDLRGFDVNAVSSNKRRKQILARRLNLDASALQWVNDALADPRYQTVLSARHALTHSRLLRHLRISTGGDPNMDRMDFKITINGNQIQVGARNLVLQSRDLAGDHVDSFLRVFDTL